MREKLADLADFIFVEPWRLVLKIKPFTPPWSVAFGILVTVYVAAFVAIRSFIGWLF